MKTVSDIKFECDQCRQRIEVPGDMLGTFIVCPRCDKRLNVAKAEDPAESAATKRKDRPAPGRASRRVEQGIVYQGVASAGMAGLLLGLFLLSRQVAPVFYLLFFLLALVSGAVACMKKLPVIGATLVLAAVIAPVFMRPPAVRPAVALPSVQPDWTQTLEMPPVARPVAPPMRPVEPARSAEPETDPGATGRALDSAQATEQTPSVKPDAGAETAAEPEPARKLSPTFSDDPFRDVFGPPPDEAPETPTVAESGPESPADAPTAPHGTDMLESDRLCRALIKTPDDTALLAKLRNEIGTIANEEKKVRLIVAYALGCLHTGNRQEAHAVQVYLRRHYQDHPLATLLSAERTLNDCARCSGSGTSESPCRECRGEGACSGCGGSGQRELSGLDGATRAVACVTCRGSGKCRRCKGRGRIESACPACKGSGKTAAAEKIRKAYLALLAGETPD